MQYNDVRRVLVSLLTFAISLPALYHLTRNFDVAFSACCLGVGLWLLFDVVTDFIGTRRAAKTEQASETIGESRPTIGFRKDE